MAGIISDLDRRVRTRDLEDQDKRQEQLDKQAKKNPEHVQIYLMQNYDKIMELKPGSIKLLLYLANIAFYGRCNQTETAYCITPLNSMIIDLKYSRQHILDCIVDLETKLFIKVFKSGRSNVYAINPDQLWKSDNSTKYKALYRQTNLTGYIVRGNIVINNKQEDNNE